MLKNSQSFFAHHVQAVFHSLNLLCRTPFATLMTMMVIAITLSLPTLFFVFEDNLSQATQDWQHVGHISIYLKDSLSESDQVKVLQQVRDIAGVGQATLKTPQEGLKELIKQEGMQDIMHFLPENPLPAVIEVTPELSLDSPAKIDLLSRQLQKLAEVEVVKLDLDWIKRLHLILDFVAKLANALMILLALAVVLIIGNTLRLNIHKRQEEIQILKLIGATDPFILRPFLYSGIWYGIGGALLTVFLVNIFILSLELVINQLAMAYQIHFTLIGLSLKQILLLMGLAVILGWLGAYCAVKKQLASVEFYN